MPVTIVVGGQYGSEGKGKVVALLAHERNEPWLVRCGGPNSGHTVTVNGKQIVFRQLPSCSDHWRATFCVAAGCVVDEDILLRELDLVSVPKERIIVDPRAILVSQRDRDEEGRMLGHIASTCSGTGLALLRRMQRGVDVRFTKDSPKLQERCRIETVAPILHSVIALDGNVIVEGTQGFALSLLHGPDYPFVTSRDTTAAGFAMEVGISPLLVDEIVMVLRTFPIRVGGTSGPFANETTWEEIRKISGAPEVFRELTSVTKRVRRVASFDLGAVNLACAYNCPTSLAVMGLDRLDFANTGLKSTEALTPGARRFLNELELATKLPVEFAGTGFGTFEVIQSKVPNLR
jgi:adenylosuccinate synthase